MCVFLLAVATGICGGGGGGVCVHACVRACVRACMHACVCLNEVGLLVSVFKCSLIPSPFFCSEVGIEIGATHQTGVWVCI